MSLNKHTAGNLHWTLWTSDGEKIHVVYCNFAPAVKTATLKEQAESIHADTLEFLRTVDVKIDALIQDSEFIFDESIVPVFHWLVRAPRYLEMTSIRNSNNFAYRWSRHTFNVLTARTAWEEHCTSNEDKVRTPRVNYFRPTAPVLDAALRNRLVADMATVDPPLRDAMRLNINIFSGLEELLTNRRAIDEGRNAADLATSSRDIIQVNIG